MSGTAKTGGRSSSKSMENGERSMLLGLDDTLENGFLVRETFLAEGDFCPPHWHDYLEFEFVTDGHGTHIYNGKSYPLSRGSTYLITYGDFHAVRADAPLSIINVRFTEEVLPEELNHAITRLAGQCLTELSSEEAEQTSLLCRKLQNEQRQKRPFYALVCQGILRELIVTLLRKTTAERAVHSDPSLVQNAVALILRDFRKNLTVASAAKALCVSPNYFGAAFRKATGVSFNEYLNRTRLKYACARFCKADRPLKGIAYEAGYASTRILFICLSPLFRHDAERVSAFRGRHRGKPLIFLPPTVFFVFTEFLFSGILFLETAETEGE